MGKILVTGGAGFIGFDFTKLLIKEKVDFVVVDKLTYAANAEAVKFFSDNNIDFFKLDINDVDVNFIKNNNVKTIVNFAAETHVDNSITNPGVFIQTNVNGTFNLVDLARELGLRYHQISTDEVYGDLPLDKPKERFSVNSPIKPSSPYSASKASADLIVNAYRKTFGIKATISRCSNNYGPFQNSEKLIPNVIGKIMDGKKVGIYGDGLNIRDWIYVRDHNLAVLKILETKDDGIFNIGSNNEINNINIVKTICKIMDVNFDEVHEFVEDRKGHDRRYAIDPKSMNDLGWTPEETFETGIKKTVGFYENK